MAVRSLATTDTLDTFRTTFNSLASTDLGDVATLSTSASSIVGAVNELNSSVAGDLVIQTFGHRYNADGSNAYTQFTVTGGGSGGTLTITAAGGNVTKVILTQGDSGGYNVGSVITPGVADCVKFRFCVMEGNKASAVVTNAPPPPN